MPDVFTGERWTSSTPPIYFDLSYSSRRDGEKMYYRFSIGIRALSSAGGWYFGYPIKASLSLDGTRVLSSYQLKAASPNRWSAPITYDTPEYELAKTSGTVALSFTLASSDGSTRTATYTAQLPIIPAGATLSVPDAGAVPIAAATAVTITKASSDVARTVVQLSADGVEPVTVYQGTGSSFSLTPGAGFYPAIVTGLTAPGVLSCTAYDSAGGSLGTTELALTLTAELAAIQPSFSVALDCGEIGAHFNDCGVVGKTSTRVVVTPTLKYGAVAKRCRIQWGSRVVYGLEATFDDLEANPTLSVDFWDSRMNKSADYSRTVTVFAYDQPSCTALRVFRANAAGAADDNGTYAGYSVNASISALGGLNDSTFKLQARKAGSSGSWADIATYSAGFTWQSTGVSSSALLNADDNYNTRLIMADYFGSVEVAGDSITPTYVTVDYYKGGHGLALGKMATEEGVDVNMPVRLRQGLQGSDWSAADSSAAAIRGALGISAGDGFTAVQVSATFSNGVATVAIDGLTAGAVVFAQRVARANDTSGSYNPIIGAARCNTDGQLKLYLNTAGSGTYDVFVIFKGAGSQPTYDSAMEREY